MIHMCVDGLKHNIKVEYNYNFYIFCYFNPFCCNDNLYINYKCMYDSILYYVCDICVTSATERIKNICKLNIKNFCKLNIKIFCK